jgi:leucyl aminopeptidase (aminopeptidase T)
MLEDEGCAGTIHLGFGSNATIGGRNDVAFHLDFVMRRPSVWIDRTPLLTEGAWSPAPNGG